MNRIAAFIKAKRLFGKDVVLQQQPVRFYKSTSKPRPTHRIVMLELNGAVTNILLEGFSWEDCFEI